MTIRQKWAVCFALALLGICFMGIANATDVKIACTAPTLNTDGTPITGAITYSLYGALQGQTKQKLVSGSTACNFTRTSVAAGTQEYYVTASVAGVESAPSTNASIVIPNPTPSAPTNVTVTITVTVTTP